MNGLSTKLLEELKAATGLKLNPTRTSLIEGLFYLFQHATNHTTARILAQNNIAVLELMQTWQAQFGGLKDDFPKKLATLLLALDAMSIDALAVNSHRVIIDVQSAEEIMRKKHKVGEGEFAGSKLLFEDIQRSNPGYKSIKVTFGGGSGNFAIDLED